MMGLVSLSEKEEVALSLSPSAEDTKRRRPSANQEAGLPRNLTVLALDLRIPASRTVRKKCFRYSVRAA